MTTPSTATNDGGDGDESGEGEGQGQVTKGAGASASKPAPACAPPVTAAPTTQVVPPTSPLRQVVAPGVVGISVQSEDGVGGLQVGGLGISGLPLKPSAPPPAAQSPRARRAGTGTWRKVAKAPRKTASAKGEPPALPVPDEMELDTGAGLAASSSVATIDPDDI